MKVTLVIAIALSVSMALKKQSAALRHWILAVGIVCAALAPLLSGVVPAWQPFPTPRHADAPTARTGTAGSTTSVEFSIPQPQARGVRPVPMTATAVLQWVWVAGMALNLFTLLAGLGRLAFLAAGARRVSDGRWTPLLGSVVLLQSEHPTLLVTWGAFRPKIILPASADTWSVDRMRIVLLHELAHIHRGDWMLQMVAELVRSVYWFNPLAWIASRRLRQESEQACDDEVLRDGVGGPEYATHLLALARDLRRSPGSRFSGFPAPAMARPSSLGRRITAMLNDRLNHSPLTLASRLAVAIALIVATIPIVAAQAFGTVSGTLIDATGAPLPGATVVLSNSQRQSKYEVRSGPAGAFEFVGVPSGTYDLTTQLPGFAPFHESFPIASGQSLQRHLKLEVGSLQETIVLAVSDADPEVSAPPKIVEAAPFQPVDLSQCTVLPIGGNIRPPKKLRDVRPVYPETLRGTGTEGIVVLETTIGLDGYVTDIEPREGGNPDLVNAAVTAVREWRFTQTILNCTPIEVRMKVTMTFRRKA